MTLVGYWPLNENSGDIAYDHSGNENHGTINDGGDSTVPGANGPLGESAYDFDGNNDESRIYPGVLVENFSISHWVKSTDLDMQCALNFRRSTSTTNTMVGYRRSGKFSFRDDDDTDATTDLAVSIPDNKLTNGDWHHVVALRSDSNVYVLIDGELYDSDNANINDYYFGDVSLGFDQWNGGRYYFNGKISEVRIYDRPLTKSEVQYLYNVGKRGLQTTSKKSS